MASNFIALEIEKHEVRVAISQSTGKQVRIRNAFQVPLMEDDSDQQIGEKLKKALSSHGASRGEAIIVVSRCQVEIREIDVPPVPDNELPALVRFKSKSEFAAVTDNWSIDFVELSGSEESSRELMATALSAQVSERLCKIVEAANLKPKSIVLRPFSTLDLISSEINDENLNMVASPNGDQIDLTLVNAGKTILTRTVRSNAHGDINKLFQQLTLEAQRTLVSATKRICNKQLEKIVVCGESSTYGPLGVAFKETLDADTVFIDPFEQIRLRDAKPESPEKYAALIGALVHQGKDQKHKIDFLNPRQPVLEKSNHNSKYILAGAVAAMILTAVFLGWWTLRSQTEKLSQLNQQYTQLQRENAGNAGVKGVEQVIGEVELVDKWLARCPNWLDELEALSKRTLDADRTVVDKFLGTVTAKRSYVNVKGRIKDLSTNNDLQDKLVDRPYKLTPKATSRGKSAEYPFNMEHDLAIPYDLESKKTELDEIARTFLYGSNDDATASDTSTESEVTNE